MLFNRAFIGLAKVVVKTRSGILLSDVAPLSTVVACSESALIGLAFWQQKSLESQATKQVESLAVKTDLEPKALKLLIEISMIF